jgi:hypothetical protein
MKLRSLLLFLLFINSASLLNAQDLLSTLGNDNEKSHDLTIATFKTTRLVNFHTLETVGPKTLDFRISHRFGAINSKGYNAWGIDGPVNIRLSLEYSPDGRFMFGIGRQFFNQSDVRPQFFFGQGFEDAILKQGPAAGGDIRMSRGFG